MTSQPLTETAQAVALDETVRPRRRTPPSAAAPRAERDARRTQHDEASPRGPELDATVPPRQAVDSHVGRGDLLLYLLLAALVGAAWQIGEMGLLQRNDDTSYWIGVVGGSFMLALFVYPLRKYARFMQGWGKVKVWFWAHLALGISGPWLILIHSQFRIGSVNAGVALISMCIVVVSGVVGRFIYVRIHRGLHGERTSLDELRRRAGLVEDTARSRLHFCPAVEDRLQTFERRVLQAHPEWTTHLSHVALLPIQQWITHLRCVRDLRQPLHQLARQHGWEAVELRRRQRRARRLVDQYLNAVVRVAQYSAYERVFALWHMAHLPFIYLLVISAVVHVVAVHAY
ncbi:MAG: hypothetical protein KIT60_19325 [Burkholderiaceae bacterium]|nr:hypothetical protein [Burkholderiaceae bacterium]